MLTVNLAHAKAHLSDLLGQGEIGGGDHHHSIRQARRAHLGSRRPRQRSRCPLRSLPPSAPACRHWRKERVRRSCARCVTTNVINALFRHQLPRVARCAKKRPAPSIARFFGGAAHWRVGDQPLDRGWSSRRFLARDVRMRSHSSRRGSARAGTRSSKMSSESSFIVLVAERGRLRSRKTLAARL